MDSRARQELQELPGLARKGLAWVCFSLLAVAALFWGASELPGTREAVLPLLEGARWGWIGLGWVFMCAALWALGHRWKSLLPPTSVPGWLLGAALCAALLLNYALPGPFGEDRAVQQL